MGLPTRRAKRHLPCGCPDNFMAYGGSYLVCTNPKDLGEAGKPKQWEWQPATWRYILQKAPKDDSNAESGETADVEHEQGLLSRVLGRKEKIPAQ